MNPVFLLCAALLLGVSASHPDRYFKEDYVTGADYLHLGADGVYSIIMREHMGIWVSESGRWESAEHAIRFLPNKPGKPPYTGTVVSYKAHTFLTFETEAAPGIVISEADIRQRLDSEPDVLPLYVFFKVSKKVFEQETKELYPFRTLRRSPVRKVPKKGAGQP